MVPGGADRQRVAAASVTWWSRPRTSTASSPTRRTRPTTSSSFNQAAIYYDTRFTTSAATRAASRPTTNETYHHDGRGAAAVEQRRGEPLVLARRRVLQPARPATPNSTASCATTRTRRHSPISTITSRTLGQSAGADRTLVPGRLRPRARADGRVRRARLRRDRQFHDYGRRPLVRLRPQLRPAPGVARGFNGARARRRRAVERGRHSLQAEPAPTVRPTTTWCMRPIRRASASAAAIR